MTEEKKTPLSEVGGERSPFYGKSYALLSACGNTALVMRLPVDDISGEQVRELLSGEYGVRADNLLLYSTRGLPRGLDIIVDGFNADGSRVGLCGNGARCLAWYAVQAGEIHRPSGVYEMLMDDTRLRLVVDEKQRGNQVAMLVSPPSFDPDTVPFRGDASHGVISLLGENYEYIVVHVGNPQIVLLVSELPSQERIIRVGEYLQRAPELFPEKVNVSFVKIESMRRARVKIFERGVGITSASGTGSVAVATALRSFQGLESEIEVVMDGGSQMIVWPGGAAPIHATTEVSLLEEGHIGGVDSP